MSAAAHQREQRIEAVTGESATVDGDEIVVLDAQARPVVRYSQAAGLRIIAATGDITLSAPEGRVVIEADDISMNARRWRTRVDHASHMAGRWELNAERAVETVRDAFRTVEGLLQTRADRMRNVVGGAYDLFAGRTSIASDEETKIDGKNILLG